MKKQLKQFIYLSLLIGWLVVKTTSPVQAVEAEVLKDGIYKIQNDMLHATEDKESIARGYMDQMSTIQVVDGKLKLSLDFIATVAMSNFKVSVNDQEMDYQLEEIEGGKRLTFDLQNIQDSIKISMKVMNFMNVTFRVSLLEETLVNESDSSGETTPEQPDAGDEAIPEQPDTGDGSIPEQPDAGDGAIPEQPDTGGETTPEQPGAGDEGISTIQDGVYTVSNQALHATKDEESIARQYLNPKSRLEVVSGKMMLTLAFTDADLMANHQVSVNGTIVEMSLVEKGQNNVDISIPIESLQDQIMVSTTVMGAMNVSFRVYLEEDSLTPVTEGELPEQTPEIDEDQKEEESDEVIEPEEEIEVPEMSESSQVYKVTNEVKSDSTIGYQAARNALAKTSYLEETEEGTYITLGFGQTNLMSQIRVSVDGKSVAYQVIRENSASFTKDIRFKVGSVSSVVTITAYIEAIERDISFDVIFLKDSLQLISQSQLSQTLGTPQTEEIISSTDESVNEENGSTEEVVANIVASSYIKTYEIKNEVVSDSVIGKSMARKYLNEMSIIEEIDGKLYVSLTFSGTDSMDHFRFEVNGNEVESLLVNHDVTLGTKTFKIPLESVTDEIHVYLFVKPVKMNIDFGIRLLEDTMVLVSEEMIETEQAIDDLVNQAPTASTCTPQVEKESSFKVILMTAVVTVLLNNVALAGIARFKQKKVK